MTIDKLKTVTVDPFPSSRRRRAILDGFKKVLDRLRADGVQSDVWIDGSFLTKKIDPADSDILVVMQGSFFDNATPAQIQTIGWAAGMVEPDLLCHSHTLIQYPPGHAQHCDTEWYGAYWLRQFGFSRKDGPKGIAVIKTP